MVHLESPWASAGDYGLLSSCFYAKREEAAAGKSVHMDCQKLMPLASRLSTYATWSPGCTVKSDVRVVEEKHPTGCYKKKSRKA
jgi:hypothetical protein